MDHPMDALSIMQENGIEQVNMARGVPMPRDSMTRTPTRIILVRKTIPTLATGTSRRIHL